VQQKRCQSLLRLDRCSLVPSVASIETCVRGRTDGEILNGFENYFSFRVRRLASRIPPKSNLPHAIYIAEVTQDVLMA